MRRTLPADYADGAGALDPEAIATGRRRGPGRRCATPTNCTKRCCGAQACWPASGESRASTQTLAAASRATDAARSAAAILGPRRATRTGPPRLSRCCNRRSADRRARPRHARSPKARKACAAEILRGWFECSGPRDRLGLAPRARHAARPGRPGAGATRSRRPDPARPIHAGSRGEMSSGATAACWRASTA